MNDLAQPATADITADAHDRVLGLSKAGQYLQAYREAEALAPLKGWRGIDGRILASGMAGDVGPPRLAHWNTIRAVLPVGYVRRHRQTCAAATLAAVSRYWMMPADRLEVAATITYGGTPYLNEHR